MQNLSRVDGKGTLKVSQRHKILTVLSLQNHLLAWPCTMEIAGRALAVDFSRNET